MERVARLELGKELRGCAAVHSSVLYEAVECVYDVTVVHVLMWERPARQ